MTRPQNRLVIRGGSVITCDPELGSFGQADLLIEGDKITAIAPSLEVENVEVLDATDFVVMPGMIDTHRHVTDAIYSQFSADMTLGSYFKAVPGPHGQMDDEDIYQASRSGARLALDAGVTTVLDWSLSAHTLSAGEAALDGYSEAGARILFAYGPGAGVIGVDPDLANSSVPDDTAKLRDRCEANEAGLTQVFVAGRGPEFTTFDIARQEIEMARSLGLKTSIHMGGLTIGMHEKVLELDSAGLLGPDLHFAHCCLLSDREMKAMEAAGVGASVSPFVEATLGIGPCAYRRLRDAGVVTGLSIDSPALAGHGLFPEARALLALERSPEHTKTLLGGADPENNDFLTSSDVLQALTLESARSVGLEDKIGSITPGKAADLILINKKRLGVRPLNGPSALVLNGDAALIDTVIVGGVIRKRGGELIDVPYEGVMEELSRLAQKARPELSGVQWLP